MAETAGYRIMRVGKTKDDRLPVEDRQRVKDYRKRCERLKEQQMGAPKKP